MNRPLTRSFSTCLALGLSATGIAVLPFTRAQDTQEIRPGLTARQTKQASELARGTMTELRQKTEGATAPDADRREYILAVELLAAVPPAARASSKVEGKPGTPKAEPAPAAGQEKVTGNPGQPAVPKPGPFAVVTAYRYLDDLTVFSTVDLGTGRVVDVQAARHLRSPLSDEEFEEAKALARERSEPVKALYEHFGDRLSAYPQFSQYKVKEDPRIHRVVHLTYRVGTKDLSYPRPVVDLSTRQVETPGPEVFPQPRRR